MIGSRAALVCVMAFGMAAAQVPDLSGVWHLNVAKSRWGKHPKPTSAEVTIEHHEPAFKYSGTIIFPNGVNTEGGEDARTFTFNGAIDGNSYPVGGTLAEGSMAFRRVSANTIESNFQAADGKLTETARTTISGDGKTLIREMRAKNPTGETTWTELYDRK